MKSVVIRPAADRDIDEAIEYVFQENPRAALRLLAAIEKACDTIARSPRVGSLRFSDALPVEGLRFLAVAGFPYLVFYFERRDHVDVVRVLHARRDIPALLQEDLPEDRGQRQVGPGAGDT